MNKSYQLQFVNILTLEVLHVADYQSLTRLSAMIDGYENRKETCPYSIILDKHNSTCSAKYISCTRFIQSTSEVYKLFFKVKAVKGNNLPIAAFNKLD